MGGRKDGQEVGVKGLISPCLMGSRGNGMGWGPNWREGVSVYQESGVNVREKEARANSPSCLPADPMTCFGSLQNQSGE